MITKFELNREIRIMAGLKIPSYLIQTGVSWLSKILNISMQIILIPLVFKFLGIDYFALYSFMLGISAWFNLGDLSTGVVVQNLIIKDRADNRENHSILINSFYFYIVLVIVFSVISIAVYPLIYKYFIHKLVPNLLENSVAWSWSLFCLLYLSNTIFQQNTPRVYYALGKGFQINLLNLVGSVSGYLLLLIVLCFLKVASLIIVISLGVLPNTFINIVAYYKLIDKKDKFLLSEYIVFIKSVVYKTRHFFSFAILGSFVLQLDYLLIAHYLLANDIIQYNWYTKIFGAVYALFTILLGNYYSDCAHRLYKHQYKAAIHGVLMQFCIGAMLIISCVVFLLFSRSLLSTYFFHSQVHLSVMVAVVYGIYFILRAWTEAWSVPLFSLNQGKSLIVFVSFQVIISLSLQIILIKHFGLVGLLTGLAISFLFTVCWLYPYRVMVYLKQSVKGVVDVEK